jgi:hypothetical protein
MFHLPLSEESYEWFCELHIILQSLPSPGGKYIWTYIWGNGEYSSRKAYKHLIGSQAAQPTFSWIWKSKCQMKQKVFYGLLLQNRLNTRAMLRQRHLILESYSCELCFRQVEESLKNPTGICFSDVPLRKIVGCRLELWFLGG